MTELRDRLVSIAARASYGGDDLELDLEIREAAARWIDLEIEAAEILGRVDLLERVQTVEDLEAASRYLSSRAAKILAPGAG